ncbi:MAG TPA: hypothetical protein VEU53_02250, partial [Stellaceae bacterium]|nr:hypothetical protein [Stellaceae bacterium]
APQGTKKRERAPLSEEAFFLFRRYPLDATLNSKCEAGALIAVMSAGLFRSSGSATPDIMVR